MTGISCDCSVDSCDFEGPEFCNDKIVTARKEHQCCECDETIFVGQKYEYTAGLWDGYFETYKTCLTCVNIRDDFCPSGHIYGGLRETIFGCIGLDYISGETALWVKKEERNE